MRITLVTSGTRGDAQPLLVLAAELRRRGHVVTLGLPPNLVDLGLRCGFRTAAFGPDTLAFMESPEGQRWLAAGNVSSFMKELSSVSRAHIPQTMSDMHRLADGAELIVAGVLAEDLAICSAEALEVPYASLHSAPYRRTRAFPQFMVTNRLLPGPVNRATGALFDRVWWRGVRENVAAFRGELGLPPDTTPTAAKLARADALELQAYSSSLVPVPPDYGRQRPLVGFLLPGPELRHQLDDVTDGGLDQWLDAGDAPVYVGMGSMPITDPAATLAMVSEVTSRLGLRAVVSAGWSRLGAELAPEHVKLVGAVDHDTLLPRCRVAVHHGGAGTTAAGLAAGLPTLVCSVFADQPFWGGRVESLEVGVHVPFARLSTANLEAGLRRLLEQDTAVRAQRLGDRLRSESRAAEVAADHVEALRAPLRARR